MISNRNQYIYVDGLDGILIDGNVMPKRQAAAQNIIRGEDIAFLNEAACERYMLFRGTTWPTPTDGTYDASHFCRSLSYKQVQGISSYTNRLPSLSNEVFMSPEIESFVDKIVDGDIYPDYSGLYNNFTPRFAPVNVDHVTSSDAILTAFENLKKSTRVFFRFHPQSKRITLQNLNNKWTQTIVHSYNDYDQNTISENQYVEYDYTQRGRNYRKWNISRYSEELPYTFDIYESPYSSGHPGNNEDLPFVTFKNLPPGAVAYPIVGMIKRIKYYHLRRASERTANLTFCGIFHGTPKTAPSNGGSLTFTFYEAAEKAEALMEREAYNKHSSIPNFTYPLPYPDEIPPISDMVWDPSYFPTGSYVWKFSYESSLDLELFGFVVDLGNHTKWWQ